MTKLYLFSATIHHKRSHHHHKSHENICIFNIAYWLQPFIKQRWNSICLLCRHHLLSGHQFKCHQEQKSNTFKFSSIVFKPSFLWYLYLISIDVKWLNSILYLITSQGGQNGALLLLYIVKLQNDMTHIWSLLEAILKWCPHWGGRGG